MRVLSTEPRRRGLAVDPEAVDHAVAGVSSAEHGPPQARQARALERSRAWLSPASREPPASPRRLRRSASDPRARAKPRAARARAPPYGLGGRRGPPRRHSRRAAAD